MTIRNRKGEVVGVEQISAPAKKRGRPKKTEVEKTRIDPALPTGAFHQMFPFMLKYKEDNKFEKTCYFQCESHRNTHISRYKLNKNSITIGQTEPRN